MSNDLKWWRVRFSKHGFADDVASVTAFNVTKPVDMPKHKKDRIRWASQYLDVYVDARDKEHAIEVACQTQIGDLLQQPETD